MQLLRGQGLRWLADDAAVTVYTLCFVGGCMECISYSLLFRTLLGVMTVNTMAGIIGLASDTDLHLSVLHLSSVLIFLLMVLAHNLAELRGTGVARARRTLSCLRLELAVVLAYACVASGLYRHGYLQQPNVAAFGLVCAGSFALYLQNYVIQPGHPFPASTMVMTGNYVALVSHSARAIAQCESRPDALRAVRHFLLVHAHFWAGVIFMTWSARRYDFLALLVPCLCLAGLTWRVASSDGRGRHASH